VTGREVAVSIDAPGAVAARLPVSTRDEFSPHPHLGHGLEITPLATAERDRAVTDAPSTRGELRLTPQAGGSGVAGARASFAVARCGRVDAGAPAAATPTLVRAPSTSGEFVPHPHRPQPATEWASPALPSIVTATIVLTIVPIIISVTGPGREPRLG
jgi:hypothetical protein